MLCHVISIWICQPSHSHNDLNGHTRFIKCLYFSYTAFNFFNYFILHLFFQLLTEFPSKEVLSVSVKQHVLHVSSRGDDLQQLSP